MEKALLDTSFLVALLCSRDIHHAKAKELSRQVKGKVTPIITDVVFGETITVLSRRAKEWGFSFEAAVKDLKDLSSSVARFAIYMIQEFEPIVELVVMSGGKLSFNDALLIIGARQERIKQIITFDRDFEPYLKVIGVAPQ